MRTHEYTEKSDGLSLHYTSGLRNCTIIKGEDTKGVDLDRGVCIIGVQLRDLEGARA